MLNMSKYVLYVKYTQYVKYVKYNQKKLNWYTKSSTWFYVLSSWTWVSRKQTRRRPQCHSRVLPLKLSSVPPPPLEKARGGRRVRRPLSIRRVEVSWRAACAWPVLHRRVDLQDIHTLLRITEPLLRCMYCDRLTDSCAHPPLSQDADLHCRRMLTMFLEPSKECLSMAWKCLERCHWWTDCNGTCSTIIGRSQFQVATKHEFDVNVSVVQKSF